MWCCSSKVAVKMRTWHSSGCLFETILHSHKIFHQVCPTAYNGTSVIVESKSLRWRVLVNSRLEYLTSLQWLQCERLLVCMLTTLPLE